jgi:hypothetical protein
MDLMGAFFAAVLVALAVGVGASVVLEKYQTTADRAYNAPGVRIDAEPKLSGEKIKPKG